MPSKGFWTGMVMAFLVEFVCSSGMNRARFMNINCSTLVIYSTCHFFTFTYIRSSYLNYFLYFTSLIKLHKSRKEPYDPLLKPKPLMNELQLACEAYFLPGQNISIDERMVAFKGRIGMKQYIKGKPAKWRFKLWILASSDSGYTFKFQVYTGKRLTATTNGLGNDVGMSDEWTFQAGVPPFL